MPVTGADPGACHQSAAVTKALPKRWCLSPERVTKLQTRSSGACHRSGSGCLSPERERQLSSTQLQELIQALATPGDAATQAAVTLVASGNGSAAALLAADLNTPAGKVADQLLKTHAREMRHGLMTELSLASPTGRFRIVQLLSGTADPNIAPGLLRWQFDQESGPLVPVTGADLSPERTQSDGERTQSAGACHRSGSPERVTGAGATGAGASPDLRETTRNEELATQFEKD